MALFLMSYDTHFGRNYQPLYDAMEEVGAQRILESVWMFELKNTASEVRDWLRELLDDDDTIFVLKLKPKHAWAARKLEEGVADWINHHNVAG